MSENSHFKLLSFVKIISSCNGAYRGIIQIPAHMGLVLALSSCGTASNTSVAEILFWVWAFPRLFSVPLELLGGFLTQYIGSRGSFHLLPIGIFIRAISLAMILAGCTAGDPDQILFYGVIAIFLGEIGRSMFTGQYQDIVQQVSSGMSDKKQVLPLISRCETVEKNYLHIQRVVFAALGTVSVLIYHKMGSPKMYLWYFLPFLASIVIHVVALFESITWRNFQRSKNNNFSLYLNTNFCSQISHFFSSNNFLWSLGAGGFIFLYIYLVNFSAITGGVVPASMDSASLNYFHVAQATLLAIVPPIAAWASNLLLIRDSHIKFESLNKGKGLIFLSLWFILLLASKEYLHSPTEKICAAFLFAFFFSPLQTWIGWQRIPILRYAELTTREKNIFGESHVFYYALIGSTMEFAIGVFGLLMKFYQESNTHEALLIVGIISTICILIWSFNQKTISHPKPQGLT